MALPGWDSIETVTRLTKFFTIAGFFSLFLLGVFEVLGYMYSNRKDDLIRAEQVRLRDEQERAAEAITRQQQQAEQERQKTIARALDRQEEAEKKLNVLEEKQTPRVLTAKEKAALLAFLSKYPAATLTIKASMNAADARPYSYQLASVLRDAGWQVSIDNALFTGDNVTGMWLTIKNPNAIPPGLETLHEAFKRAGLPIRAQYDPALANEQEIWLSVGVKQ